MDTNTLIMLTINGITADSSVYASNGVWYAVWDTTGFSNGMYQLAFEIEPYRDGNTIMAGCKFVSVQNDICFPDNLPICGGSLYVHPQTIYTNGTWTMDIYDDQTNLFASLEGNVDADGFCIDPNTGEQGVVISLLDNNGNDLPSNFYDVVVTTYPAEGMSGVQVMAQNSSGGTASRFKRYYKDKSRGQHRNWVIAFKPIYELGTTSDSLLGGMMETAANSVHSSQYGINNDAVINQQNTTWGLPYSLVLQQTRDWGTLATLLHFSEARNFFYFGHGGSDVIGYDFNHELNRAELEQILQNAPDPLHGVNQHPYRFVFLDGCDTAKGDLPIVFGIPKNPETISQADWDNKYHLQARAFVGWPSGTGYSVRNVMPQDHLRFILNFWHEWSGYNPESDSFDRNFTLQDALNRAAQTDSGGYWTSLNRQIKLYGCPTLCFYE